MQALPSTAQVMTRFQRCIAQLPSSSISPVGGHAGGGRTTPRVVVPLLPASTMNPGPPGNCTPATSSE